MLGRGGGRSGLVLALDSKQSWETSGILLTVSLFIQSGISTH